MPFLYLLNIQPRVPVRIVIKIQWTARPPPPLAFIILQIDIITAPFNENLQKMTISLNFTRAHVSVNFTLKSDFFFFAFRDNPMYYRSRRFSVSYQIIYRNRTFANEVADSSHFGIFFVILL